MARVTPRIRNLARLGREATWPRVRNVILLLLLLVLATAVAYATTHETTTETLPRHTPANVHSL